jgi:PAS domain S-box-containing protein
MNDITWRVLLVDDDEEDYLLTRAMLAKAKGRTFDLLWAMTYEDAQEMIETIHFHAVLVDYDLGPRTGIELIQQLSAQKYPAPAILFTGRGSYDVDVEAMQAGATLYITKSEANPLLLERSIRYAIERKQTEEALRSSEERFQKAFDANPNAQVISRQADGLIQVINDGFEKLLGYSREEVAGKTSLELNMFANAADREEAIRRFKSARTLRDFELDIRTKSGEIRKASLSVEEINLGFQPYMLTVIQDITDRKRAEEALRFSDERYRVAAINTPAIFAQSDRELRYQWIHNPHPDFKAEDVLGKRDDELADSEDARKLVELKHRVLKSGIGLREEVRFKLSDGVFIYDTTIEPLRDSSNSIIGVTTAAFDITGLKNIETALQESERQHMEILSSLESEREKLAAVLENLPVGIWIADRQGNLIGKNQAADRIWAGDAPLVNGINNYQQYAAWFADSGEAVLPEEYPVAKALLTGQSVKPVEFNIRRFDGSEGTVLVSATLIKDKHGHVTGAVGVNVDITERKQAEEALRANEARFRNLADAMPQLVWMAMPDGTVDYYNNRYREYDGIAPGEGDAWQWGPVLYPIDLQPTVEAWEHAVETGTIYQIEHRVKMSDGSFRWHLSRGLPVRDTQGRVIRWFGTATDIHDTKEAEAILEQFNEKLKQSNNELEQFAFVASHDLQEPLRKIALFGGSIQKKLRGKIDPEAEDSLDRMINASERMKAMIHDLLELSRIKTQSRPFTQVDLSKSVEEVITDLDARVQQTNGQIIIDPLPVIDADPVQIQQVFLNLIGNALKFHQPDVPPVVKIYSEALPAGINQDPMIAISVEDNGIGFEEVIFEQLLQPFKRAHGRSEAFEGNGIGLAIVKKIIDRHQGEISARSIPGQGSTFVVRLPIKQRNEII